MSNQERAVEVTKTHDLFHFTSGDGWMEPYEDVIRCACGEEFFSYIQTGDGSGDDDRDPDLLYRQHLAQALADAGLLMPDLPKPDLKGGWKTEVIGAGKGFFAVRTAGVVEFVSSAGVYSNTSEMIRREALRMLAAAKLAEEQE